VAVLALVPPAGAHPYGDGGRETNAERVPAAAATTRATLSPFGVAAGGNMHNLSAAELARELDTYRGAGAGWIRIDVNWSLIQRGGPASYDWAPFDRVVNAAVARGLHVLAGVLYTPSWARAPGTNPRYPPTDLATYASFCAAVVAHYAPLGVHHWEIWNEPNRGFWQAAPDPVRYTALLKLAYRSIKGVDPSAFVVSGGLSPYGAYGEARRDGMNPVTFLERMYAAGAAGSFDALGWHPYNYGGLEYHPWSAWSQVAETKPSARSIMVANGDRAKQIWGTEFGAATGSAQQAVSEAAQASLVTAGYRSWRSESFTGPLFWYSFRDTGTNPGDLEQNFGLLRHDFSRKPSFAAFKAAARS
jgi:hypothetical protein